MNRNRILLNIYRILLYAAVIIASGAMGAGINYLYEISDWFLFLILAAVIIAAVLLFGARTIIEECINPRLEQ